MIEISCHGWVFSMDGSIAKLDQICDLAHQHDALVMVDDCHTGFIGETGRGAAEYYNVLDRVDITTGTLKRLRVVHGWIY